MSQYYVRLMEKRRRGDSSQLEIADHKQNSSDRISQLPDDLLVFILSLLTFKEATTTSILSRRWRYLWTFLRRLDFDGTEYLLNVEWTEVSHQTAVDNERLNYVRWVDNVLASHNKAGSSIEEFRVFFNLNKDYENSIHEWLRYALASGKIQKLELNLIDKGRSHDDFCTFPYRILFGDKVTFSHSSVRFEYLKTLSINFVNVSGEALEFFLRKCPLLEHLCVCSSPELTSLSIIGPFPSLKRLEISFCHNLNSVEIRDVNNLVHLTYEGTRIPFVLENVPLLVDIFIGGLITDNLEDVRLMLSRCLPKLEIFKIVKYQNSTWEEAQKFYSSAEMTNLKQLVVEVYVGGHESLMWLTNLIRASPCLERFVLEVVRFEPKFVKRKLRKIVTPYVHLKELIFTGYSGVNADFEMVMHFLENAASLQKVVVDPRQCCPSTYDYVSKYEGPFKDYILKDENKARTRAKKQFADIKVPPTIDFEIL